MMGPSDDDRSTGDEVRALVAECIEALDEGEEDPAARLCAGRPVVESAVRMKLERLQRLQLLDAPTPATQAASPPPGLETVGPYRIIEEIGHGGMGQVFLAEQTSPVEREVALKLIARGLDSETVVARFRSEQQTLARMSHASIAQVHDAGTAPDGRPYFVMEYVDGVPLNVYCRTISLDERLRLLVTVCDAVQHAHDRGAIHRDLKPSNVLVRPDGTPKVIDFGIAKALDRDSSETLLTRHDEILGTPEYMSPEQWRTGQLDVDVRSDVYSLGVLLYEIIADTPPFPTRALRAAGLREMERIVTETTPPPPSTHRGSTKRVDRSTGSGRELDWITLKALEKSKEDRYDSVRALAHDIERFLTNAPVEAGPPSALYRLRKVARRYRIQLVATSAVLVAIVLGSVASLRFAWIANERAEETNAALEDLGSSLGVALQAVEEMLVHALEVDDLERVRPGLIEETQAFFESLDSSHIRDLALKRRLASAIARSSMVYSELGRPQAAEAAARRAIEIAGEFDGTQAEAKADLLKLKGMARSSIADARAAQGDKAGALSAREASVADLRAAVELDGDPNATGALERALVNQGSTLVIEDPIRGLALIEEGLMLGVDLPHTPARVVESAVHRSRLGVALMQLGRLVEAEDELSRVVTSLDAHLHVPQARRALAYTLDHLARTQSRLGQIGAAAATQVRCAQERGVLLELHPESAVRRYHRGTALMGLAALQLQLGRGSTALETEREAVRSIEAATEAAPNDLNYRADHGRALFELGRMLHGRGSAGDTLEAIRLTEKTIEIASELSRLDPESVETRQFLATALVGNAVYHFSSGEPQAGFDQMDEAIALIEGILVDRPERVEARIRLAEAYSNRIAMLVQGGSLDESLEVARRGRAVAEAGLESSPDDYRLLTMRLDFSAHAAAVEYEFDQDASAILEAAESWIDQWPDGVPAHLKAAGIVATVATSMERGHGREVLEAQAVDLVAAALDLGFEPPPGWPDPAGELAALAQRADFSALLGED